MLELKNISIKVGTFNLDDIFLQLETGKFHVLLGPTGTGKTVLLESLVGLTSLSKGRLFCNGKDITHLPPEARGFSYLPQDNSLFPHKNVYENITFGLRLQKKYSEVEIDEKINRICTQLTILPLLNRGVQHLSGGEQQRVSLARVLVLEKPFLFLDEPTSSLHETMQENFCLLLKELQQKMNLTILMTTHHKDSAFMLADYLHFIENGKITFSSDNATFFNKPIPKSVAELLGITNLFSLKKTPNSLHTYFCKETQTNFELYHLPTTIDEKFQLGIKPLDIRIIKEEEIQQVHSNRFCATVENIICKESDALVFLKIKNSNVTIKAELSIYNLKKLNIQQGKLLHCKIKEEYARVVY